MNAQTSRSRTSIVMHRSPFRRRMHERSMRMTGDGALSVFATILNSHHIVLFEIP